jgi:hypothetical protein
MFEHMQKWLGGLGPEETQEIIQALTKVGGLHQKEEICLTIHHLIYRRVSEMGTTNDLALRMRDNPSLEAIATGPPVSPMGNSKGKSNTAEINTVVCITVKVTVYYSLMSNTRFSHRIFVWPKWVLR